MSGAGEAPRVVAVVGPTAAGKTALGVELARALGGEVVNADSMQLYAGMDIGTAKPTPAERGGVRHHLLDVWSPAREASVADYQSLARRAVDGLLARGTSAVLVGGSGLYVRAVLDDLDFPATDAAVRERLYGELATLGNAALHARLAALDPAAAAANPAANGRRVVRALEVIEVTGRPYSASLPTYGLPRWGAVQLGVDLPTERLDARVGERVRRMFAGGLVEEVQALRGELGPTARRALGYAQVLSWLDGTVPSREAAEAATVQATRRYVRRQRSWFRRDQRIRWLAASGSGPLVRSALAAIHPDATTDHRI